MFCLFIETRLRDFANNSSSKYFFIVCVSINVILIVVPTCHARNYCHGEYSLVKNSNETVLWVDYNYADSPIIFSNPSCLSEDGKTIRRICHNGTWIPEEPPLCDRISTNEHCPDAFFEYRGYCIIKYDEHLTKNSHINADKLLNSQNSRKITFCDQEQTDTLINQYESKSNGKHCNASNYVILPHDHRFHLCPENCVTAHLGSSTCFCKIQSSANRTLAEVGNLQEKKALAHLAGKDICRIGNEDSKKICDNCQKAITLNFYGFTPNVTNCSIIEQGILRSKDVVLIEEPALLLKFDDQKKKLMLFVKNPRKLSPSKHFQLECSTNAGFDTKKSVNIHEIRIRNKEESNHMAVYELRLERFIGEYWCEAIARNLTKILSNKILAYKEKKGNEYSLRLSVKDVASHYDSSHEEIRWEPFKRKLSLEIRKVVGGEVRFMEKMQFNTEQAEILLHITITKPAHISEEYAKIKKDLEKLPDHLVVVTFRTVEFCPPDQSDSSSWELTRIWEQKLPRDLCFDENYKPVLKTCYGDFVFGAYWSKLSGNCSQDIQVPVVTKQLHETLYANVSIEVMNTAISLTHNDLSYLDIYLYSEFIKKVNMENFGNLDTVNDVFRIINNLSKKNKTELSSSQILFNATDSLLWLLEDQASNENLTSNFTEQNILIKSVHPFRTNISGLYLAGPTDAFLNEMEAIYLFRNESFEDIELDNLENLDLAVQVPEAVLDSIEADSDEPSSVQIIFKVFYEDSLFANSKHKTASKVISVSIPEYGSYLNESLPIIMRSNENGRKCGFWDLGEKLQRQKGEWSSFGGKYSGSFSNNSGLHVCHFSHLTHFALLIVNEPIKIDEGDEHVTEVYKANGETNFHLNVITIIGGVLSIFGILGIFLTALLFSQWRERDGTKILLNLSAAILLEIIFLQFSGINEISDSKCTLIGCLLHYTLLSKFCWMLIYALLQYRRFVKVFDVQPKKLILKSMFFGWGFAVLPVLLTLLINPDGYSKTNICYLHGLALYIAVIFPVSLVIVANFIVFIVVMYNVTTKKVESSVENKLSVLQLYLAILLFFVLGLPWIFVIIAELVKENVLRTILMYLFCATGTLQGFILFVFYVLCNQETRFRWRRYLPSRRTRF